jgi:hypothetical protein
MKFLTTPLFLLFVFSLTGCNKHNILTQEREKLDAERQAVQAQIAEMDRAIQAMPDEFNLVALQRKLEEVEKKAQTVEAEAGAKMKKWEDIEARFLPLKKQAEAYRAKNNL